MALPVSERFRPVRVWGNMSQSSSAVVSGDACMEAELGPVGERSSTERWSQPIVSSLFHNVLPQLFFFSGCQWAENEIELEADMVSFSLGFCLHEGPCMTWQRSVLQVTDEYTGTGMWKIRSRWKDRAPLGSSPDFSVWETVWNHLSDRERNFNFRWTVSSLN